MISITNLLKIAEESNTTFILTNKLADSSGISGNKGRDVVSTNMFFTRRI